MTCIAELLEEAGSILGDEESDLTQKERMAKAGGLLEEVADIISSWTPNPELEEQIGSKADYDDCRLNEIDNYNFDQMYTDIVGLEEKYDALEEEKEEIMGKFEALKGDHEKLFNEVQILYGMLHKQKVLSFSTGHGPGPRSEIRFVCENNAFIPEDMSK